MATESTYIVPTGDTSKQLDTKRGESGTINRLSTLSSTTPPAPTQQTVPSTALTSSSLTPQPSFNLTPVAPSTAMDGWQGYMDAHNTLVSQSRQQLQADEHDLTKVIAKQLTETGAQDQLYKDIGVDTAKELKRKTDEKMIKSRHAQMRELEALGKNGALTPAQLAAQTNAINRRYTFEQADIAIEQLTADGDYYGAKEVADRAVTAMMERQRNELDAKMFNFKNNLDLFDKMEQRQFLMMHEQEQRRVENEDFQMRSLWSQKIDQENALFSQKIAQENAAYTHSLDNKSNNSAVLTPEQQNDPFVQKLLATAGGKPLTDTPLNSLTKGRTVLGQVGALQANISQSTTGPILGLFRGANPWDTNAQLIKAQLNAVVPNLARGVYGEVGVLTDNDMKTYSQTLGNLSSTQDVNNAILYITVDLIGKSIKNTLEVQAAGGRDVSGFVDIYTEMEATKNSILSQLPQNIPTTQDEEDAFDSIVSGSTPTSSGGGFFSQLWKGLTGQ